MTLKIKRLTDDNTDAIGEDLTDAISEFLCRKSFLLKKSAKLIPFFSFAEKKAPYYRKTGLTRTAGMFLKTPRLTKHITTNIRQFTI